MSPSGDLPDYYELLGVTKDADEATIREAHRELGKTTHPDLGGNAALYRLITRARDTLVDPELRAAYDESSAQAGVKAGVQAGVPSGVQAGLPSEVSSGDGRKARLRRAATLPVGGVVVVALGVAAYFAFGASSSAKPKNPTPTTTTTPGSTAGQTTTFNDPADGFSITYPKAWNKVATQLAPFQADVPGTQDAMRVQVFRLGSSVDTSNQSQIKAYTDTVVAASGRIAFESPITVNKMVGYYYQNLYTSGGQEGSNSLYFFFQGRKMSILTFQSLPVTDFTKLSPTFAQIVDSYKSNPAILGPVPAAAAITPKPTTKAKSTSTTAKKS